MDNRQGNAALTEALRAEQCYVDSLYARLDEERERAETRLHQARLHGSDGGTRQAMAEREASVGEETRRLAQLNSVDSGLCFGRLDTTERETRYIGRIGLRDADYEPLLVDWRAPAAHPFYSATPGAPGEIVRRRHLRSVGRKLTGVHDEVFAPEDLTERDQSSLVGEAALLTSLRRGRTGRMTDVVPTIQREQDRVIRSGLQGVLVVQGGPGTGKTVAALHRAAYLLYTHRATLARRGVLVIGPNAVFLRYIGEVLPSLGETDVVLTPLGGLFPGLRADAPDPDTTAVVKGDTRMADVLARAVSQHQHVPEGDLLVPVEGARPGDEITLRLPHAVCQRALDTARGLRLPHNEARERFLAVLLHQLVRVQAHFLDLPVDEQELTHGPGELWRQASVRRTLGALWPTLTPYHLVSLLLTDADALRAAARPYLTETECEALLRDPGAEWTVGDVPLLDEAAELLGEDRAQQRAEELAAERERREEEAYALASLQISELADLLDPAELVARHHDTGPVGTTADRAAADRTWAYGHVIVDEAQELSPMAWRTVLRRVPSRSMTVVGDVAQTGSAAGAKSWTEALGPFLGDRWREERLTVNYRTPAEVMEPAARLLTTVAPEITAPDSVREEGQRPRAVRVEGDDLVPVTARVVDREAAALRADGGGRSAVIAPESLTEALAGALPRAARGGGLEALDAEVTVLDVRQAKGLEFDRVVVADPAGILAESPRGGRDLYVALTRVTHRLTVVHQGELPPVLGRLTPAEGEFA